MNVNALFDPMVVKLGPGAWRIRPHMAAEFDLRKAGEGDEEIVYLIQAEEGGPVKIGRSTQVGLGARIKALQTGNPSKLVVRRTFAGDRQVEADLHGAFYGYRLTGEWFMLCQSLATLMGKPRRLPSEFDRGYDRGFSEGRNDGYNDGWRDGLDYARVRVVKALNIELQPCTCPTLAQEAA